MTDATNCDPEIAAAVFEAQAERVHQNGQPFPGGRWLRESAHAASLACDVDGTIHASSPDDDWSTLCHDAIDHVRETGHRVVVDFWRGAIYGPED